MDSSIKYLENCSIRMYLGTFFRSGCMRCFLMVKTGGGVGVCVGSGGGLGSFKSITGLVKKLGTFEALYVGGSCVTFGEVGVERK